MSTIKNNFLLTAAIVFTCGILNTTLAQPSLAETPVTDSITNAPYKWKEHWFEHKEMVTRVYVDSNVAVYFDKDVNSSVTWPFSFFSKAWKYTTGVYGSFGSDTKLYAIFHTDKLGGGHPASYMDKSHDYHNVLDCGTSGGAAAWQYAEGWNIGAPVHEMGHIVEGAAKGIQGSPAWDQWGDSKWAEIFVYDVYRGIGLANEAAAVRSNLLTNTDDFPRAGTHWFRDWFLPIYEQYGEAKVLNRYFELLAANFPKKKNRQGNAEYTRRMDWGEFIHYWSGAAGVNLQPLAEKAFGWPAEYQQQFTRAQATFPAITYTGK